MLPPKNRLATGTTRTSIRARGATQDGLEHPGAVLAGEDGDRAGRRSRRRIGPSARRAR